MLTGRYFGLETGSVDCTLAGTYFKSLGRVRTVAYTIVGLSPLSRYRTTAESTVCGMSRCPIATDNEQATAVMHASVTVFCRKLSSTIILPVRGYVDECETVSCPPGRVRTILASVPS